MLVCALLLLLWLVLLGLEHRRTARRSWRLGQEVFRVQWGSLPAWQAYPLEKALMSQLVAVSLTSNSIRHALLLAYVFTGCCMLGCYDKDMGTQGPLESALLLAGFLGLTPMVFCTIGSRLNLSQWEWNLDRAARLEREEQARDPNHPSYRPPLADEPDLIEPGQEPTVL